MKRRIEIIQQKIAFSRFIFKIDEITVRHEKFDGSMSAPITRLVFERGDAAAVLLHDETTDSLLFCEQFRVPTIKHHDGWIIELAAGIVDANESPEDCARRETFEETGQTLEELKKIVSFYTSPGGSSERIHLFYGKTSIPPDLPKTAGLASENEDIRTVLLPTHEAFELLHSGAFTDAKTIIALQWLELNHVRV